MSGFVQHFPVDNTHSVDKWVDNTCVTGLDTLERGKIKYFVDTKTFTDQVITIDNDEDDNDTDYDDDYDCDCDYDDDYDQVIRTALGRPPDYQWTKNALFPETLRHGDALCIMH